MKREHKILVAILAAIAAGSAVGAAIVVAMNGGVPPTGGYTPIPCPECIGA